MGSISIHSNEALQQILADWDTKHKRSNQQTFSQIVECKLESLSLEQETMEWAVMRCRTDKSDPNSEITLLGTLKTILYPLSLNMLKQVAN